MSKVIKHFDAATQAGGSRAFDMAEVGEVAQEIIATAEEKAARIVREAEAHAQTLRKQAYDKGLREGTEAVKGRLEAQMAEEIRKSRTREVENLVKMLRNIIEEIDQHRAELVRQSREQLISLAISIARSVIKREVKCSADVARLNLEEAIRLSAQRSRLLVRVSEMDMKMLEDLVAERSMLQQAESAVELVPSPEIVPGGCLIESANGSVDARIETQLREIEKVLVGEDADG